MPPGQSTTNTVRLHLTVTDVLGVQRVLTMLTGRRYALTRFAATGAGDGPWRVTLDVLADADQVELLAARLDRSPSVLTLGLESGAALAATG
ncbi:MAG TPA: hypothetical protein VEZ18_10265 [Geodermatophilus sp.]|jgi:hypothetical protein|nr:hypothetical protein [Geodermatophilus sp.]